jgi:hypothetical protein
MFAKYSPRYPRRFRSQLSLGNIVGAGHNMDDARLEIDHVGSKAEEYLWTCLTTNTATNAR